MRKLNIIFILICVLFLSSCTPYSTEIKSNNTNYKLQDFFTFKGNFKITYRSQNNSCDFIKTVFVDYINNNTIQLRIITPSNIIGQVIEYDNNELRIINSRSEFYYLDNIISHTNKEPEILLKEPIKVGTKWDLPDGSIRYISGINIDVKTPIGTFKALEVTTKSNNTTIIDYYAVGLGPIKTVYKNGETTTEMVIDKIENNAKYTQIIKFYYPDPTSDSLIYTKNKVSFKTNDILKNTIENYFKNPPSELLKLISDDTNINKLYFNYGDHIVYIDFSEDFLNYINENFNYSVKIVKCIVNTLADYYNTDKVCITFNNKPFSLDSLENKKNNIYYVDYKNIKEYKK